MFPHLLSSERSLRCSQEPISFTYCEPDRLIFTFLLSSQTGRFLNWLIVSILRISCALNSLAAVFNESGLCWLLTFLISKYHFHFHCLGQCFQISDPQIIVTCSARNREISKVRKSYEISRKIPNIPLNIAENFVQQFTDLELSPYATDSLFYLLACKRCHSWGFSEYYKLL